MRRIRTKAILVGFTVLLSGSSYANEEITADLPGGATMEMVWIEPGTFTMGTPDTELGNHKEEGPQHQVTLTQGFYLGKYEITQEQWQAVMETEPWSGKFGVSSKSSDPKRPAVYISWDDVQGLVHELNQAAGDSLYRLPTEAEWEYACRTGTTTTWSFGDDESQLEDYAFVASALKKGVEYAQPVGMKLPNSWGLFDMHGNVWEWVQDWYGVYSSDNQTDPHGPAEGSDRVARGGSFAVFPRRTWSAFRATLASGTAGGSTYHIGVRLLRVGPAKPTAVAPQSWGQLKKDTR